MPAPNLEYYGAVAELMVPFLRRRHVVVEQRLPRAAATTYRRHTSVKGRQVWIAISRPADVVEWVRTYTVGFHANLRPNGPGCWFVLDIDARERPLAVARVAVVHAFDVLAAAGLSPLVKFSGANGFHLMWEIPSLRGLGRRSIWDVERAIVRELARITADRLAGDDRAAPLRQAVGEGRLIATNSQDGASRAALLFDENILKPNVNVRVPYSLHASSGLVSLPLRRDELERFEPAQARPELVSARMVELPRHDLAALRHALARWAG